MLYGINKSLNDQIELLEQILLKNEKLNKVLTILSNSKLRNYYIAAGCVNQTVFNYYHGYELDYGITDFDIVYFDEDLSYELVVFAPYGLNDLFNMTIRPDKRQFTKEHYLLKINKWKEKWPLLNVLSWDE